MKKLFALSLALIIILSVAALSSCQKELTPYELISAAEQKLSEADGIEAKVNMQMKMSLSGITMDIPMEITIVASGLKSDNPTAKVSTETSIAGTTANATAFLKDGMYYVSSPTGDFKVDPNAENAETFLEGMKLDDQLADLSVAIPEEAYSEDIVIVKNDDGTQSVAFAFTEEQFKQYFADTIESAAASAGSGDLKITDAKVTVTVNADGNLKKIDMSFKMDMTIAESGLSMNTSTDVTATYEYVKIGDGVTVAPIEGYESFTSAN